MTKKIHWIEKRKRRQLTANNLLISFNWMKNINAFVLRIFIGWKILTTELEICWNFFYLIFFSTFHSVTLMIGQKV